MKKDKTAFEIKIEWLWDWEVNTSFSIWDAKEFTKFLMFWFAQQLLLIPNELKMDKELKDHLIINWIKQLSNEIE